MLHEKLARLEWTAATAGARRKDRATVNPRHESTDAGSGSSRTAHTHISKD